MKRHLYGPGHGIITELLSYAKVQASVNKGEDECVTTLLSVQTRICADSMSLCLRIQHWALLSSTKRDMMLSKTNFVMICDHITTCSPKISRLIESHLENRRTELGCRTYPDVFKCRYCNLDYKVETKEIGDSGLALVIPKWLDLGSGLTQQGYGKFVSYISLDLFLELGFVKVGSLHIGALYITIW